MTTQDQLIRTLKRMDARETNQLERMLCLAEKYNIVPEEMKPRLNPEAQAAFDRLVEMELKN
jgi:hypothetical protein